MRYRVGEVPAEGTFGSSGDFVTFTVCLTMIIGVIFLVAGLKGKQRWLAIWGALTIVACFSYGAVLYFDILP